MWESEASRERYFAWYLSKDYINGGNPNPDDGQEVRKKRKKRKKDLEEVRAKRELNAPKEKKCRKCGAVKPLTDFVARPQMKDGYLNMCKRCFREYRRARRTGTRPTYRIVPSPM